MPTLTRTPKPMPTTLYRCVGGFIFRSKTTGVDETIAEDARLLGSHEAVQRYPTMFIPDGQDDLAVRKAKADNVQHAVDLAVRGKR